MRCSRIAPWAAAIPPASVSDAIRSSYMPDAPVAANDTVHCYNVHDCKGNSDCKTAEHSCKGQNVCKGHGFKAVSAAKCLSSKGTIGDM